MSIKKIIEEYNDKKHYNKILCCYTTGLNGCIYRKYTMYHRYSNTPDIGIKNWNKYWNFVNYYIEDNFENINFIVDHYDYNDDDKLYDFTDDWEEYIDSIYN